MHGTNEEWKGGERSGRNGTQDSAALHDVHVNSRQVRSHDQ